MVRVFDDKLQLTAEEMKDYLKKADLEKYGFEKTVEETRETDEYGKTTIKKTIYYKVTDDCSRVKFWEGVLKQRMPEKLHASRLSAITVKEVQNRIIGRKTKSCTVGLEIHPNRCSKETGKSRVSKRGAKACEWCLICWSSSIRYA